MTDLEWALRDIYHKRSRYPNSGYASICGPFSCWDAEHLLKAGFKIMSILIPDVGCATVAYWDESKFKKHLQQRYRKESYPISLEQLTGAISNDLPKLLDKVKRKKRLRLYFLLGTFIGLGLGCIIISIFKLLSH